MCIVTGSTAGIGRATAERFAAEGGSVVVSGRRKDLGEEIAAAIRKRGQRSIFVRCDVGVDAEMDALVARTVEEFGGLDVLVNNAAAVDEGHSYNAEDLDQCRGSRPRVLGPATPRQRAIGVRVHSVSVTGQAAIRSFS